jgi:flagellar biosynthetic protein FliR
MIDAFALFGLLLVRPGMLILTAPFFGAVFAPPQVRAGLALLLAFTLSSLVPMPHVSTAVGLTAMLGREAAIGLALGLAIRALTAVAEFAGELGSYQSGMSAGAMVDPVSGVRNTEFASIYTNLTIIICFATNAHHAFLRALVASYQSVPMGLGSVDPGLAGSVARMLGFVFVFGMRLAAPMLVVMLLVEVVLGLMTKVAPSLNIMVLGAPLRVPVGLLLVAVTTTTLPSLITHMVPAALQLALETARAFR